MGFDLEGQRPRNEKGISFRNNCWFWRPLWNYAVTVGKVLSEKDAESGSYNDGMLISERKSLLLAAKLKEEVTSGRTKKYKKEYQEYLKSLPLKECWLCRGTGQRHDHIINGECNACNGTGKRIDSACDYPFSEDNVKEFIAFCESSGGFRIY